MSIKIEKYLFRKKLSKIIDQIIAQQHILD